MKYDGNDPGQFHFTVETNNDKKSAGSPPQNEPDHRWHYMTGVYDGSEVKIYTNGELTDSTSLTGDIKSSSGSVLAIGQESDGTRSIDAKIDDVRLYDAALTTSEVRSAMTSPKQPFASWQTRGGQDLKPMAHWTFDEGTGQKAYDSIGDNDGDLGGSTGSESSDPSWTSDCRYRGCLDFDGSDDEISFSSPVIDSTSAHTVSLWMRVTGWSESRSYRAINTNDNTNGFRIFSSRGGDGNLYYTLEDSGTRYETTSSYSKNEWIFVTGVYDESNQYLYVNSELKDAVSSSGSGSDPEALSIGSWGDGSSEYYEGKIDDVRIYNRSLSNSSIKALYNAPSSSWSPTSVQVRTSAANPEDEDLVGSWSFEGVGQNVVDSSNYNNHGTLGTNASASPNDSTRVAGYSGKGMEFDGINDYVNVPADNSLNMSSSGEVTLSTWVNLNDWPNNYGIAGRYDYGDGSQRYGYMLYTKSGGEFRFQVANDTHSYPSATGFSTDKWHHLVGTYDGSDIKIFVNGDLEGTASHSAGIGVPSYGFRIGTVDDTFTNMNGTIDEVKVYNRSLSTSEVQALYNISDFTPASRFNQGSHFNVDSSNDKGEFKENYLQYKLNSLSGDFGPPTVEKAEVAHASGWTGYSNKSGVNLSLPAERYGKVQVNLSSSVPENSSVVSDLSLHTKKSDGKWLCNSPETGDWVLTRNCTIDEKEKIPGNLEIRDSSTLNLTRNGVLDVDLKNDYILVRKTSRLLMDALAVIS